MAVLEENAIHLLNVPCSISSFLKIIRDRDELNFALHFHVILLGRSLAGITLLLTSQKKFSSKLIKIRDLYRSRKLTDDFSCKIIFIQHPQFVLHKRHLRAHLLKS